MKKTLLSLTLVLLTHAAAFSQSQSLSFSDGSGDPLVGSYGSSSSFTLNTSVTFSGYNASGLSYWLQVPSALAPFVQITGIQYFNFTDPNQGDTPKTFNDPSGASMGFLSDKGATLSGDLGGTTNSGTLVPGTYQVTALTFTLSGAPVGSFQLQSTTVNPKVSIVSAGGPNFESNVLPTASYTINVVPEPSTWALLTAGGVALLGFTARRRFQRA